MKRYKITYENKKAAQLYTFLDLQGKDPVDDIAKEIQFNPAIGYAGFRTREGLKKFLAWSVKGRKGSAPRQAGFRHGTEEKSASVIADAVRRCRRLAATRGTTKIFLLPTFDPFVRNRMSGVSGYCAWKNAIMIGIHPEARRLERALRDTVCHEFTHSACLQYNQRKTLLDSIVFEGLAEHFRENVVGGGRSPWVSALNEGETRRMFKRIKTKLNSKSYKIYKEVFFGDKTYPLWSGYSIGYQIVKKYLSKIGHRDWNQIFRKHPKEILKESRFV